MILFHPEMIPPRVTRSPMNVRKIKGMCMLFTCFLTKHLLFLQFFLKIIILFSHRNDTPAGDAKPNEFNENQRNLYVFSMFFSPNICFFLSFFLNQMILFSHRNDTPAGSIKKYLADTSSELF